MPASSRELIDIIKPIDAKKMSIKSTFETLEFPQDSINKSLLLIGLSVVLFYLSHYVLMGEELVIYAHDNLDSNFVFYKVLGESDQLFASNQTIVPPIMNGLPRSAYPTELSVVTMLYTFFKPYQAYILNEILLHLAAYIGMCLLLANHIFNGKNSLECFLCIGIATAFAVLPFYPWGGLSVAGLPLATYSFLNIRKDPFPIANWLIIVIIPFYSSLILSGMFFLFLVTCLLLRDSRITKKMNYPFLLAIVAMSMAYLIAEYRLVLSLFSPVYVSHRQEVAPETLNLLAALESSKGMLLNGQYHAHSLQPFFILPFVLIAPLIVMAPSKIRNYFAGLVAALVALVLGLNIGSVIDWNRLVEEYLLYKYPFYVCCAFIFITIAFFFKGMKEGLLTLSLLSIALLYGLWQSEALVPLKNAIPIIKQIQFDRFYFLNALLWFLLFAFLAKRLFDANKYTWIAITVCIVSQIVFSFRMIQSETWREPVSLKDFYLPELYSEVKEFINKPVDEYRVASIGFDPLIAAYNGFYTLDGYCANYPLSYKHEFRKIIAGELAKNEACRKYFDNWGSRCYLFVCDAIPDDKIIRNLALNSGQFKKMGGEFIFSKYLINNPRKCGIFLVVEFSRKDQTLYLYKVI